MSKITEETVEKVLYLARLKPKKAEISRFAKQLGSVLEYIGNLAKLDVSKVPETHQVTGISDIFQTSVKQETLLQEEALKNASESEDGMFKVKSVLKS